jgi:branched-chain amino acid transport system ATP-binding protein
VLASDLSGGQLKLLELGRLLMLGSRFVLLDEPIGGVNPVLAHKLLSQIREIRDRFATTFLIIEHRLDIAMQYAEFVHVMSDGQVVQEGAPAQILNSEFYRVYL